MDNNDKLDFDDKMKIFTILFFLFFTSLTFADTKSNFDKGLFAFNSGNYEKAIRLFKDAANQGEANAQYNLGIMYSKGRGVTQDYQQAAKWYTLAAEQGVANAQYNLGVLFHQGLGVNQDLDQALYWYKESAKNNHPEAEYNLGIAYIEGIGTDYNPQLAAAFFERASEAK